MNLKKFLAGVFAAASIFSSQVEASPTCVLVRFENDTRFHNIDSASVLSDLVVEKLLASGKFDLVESKPIDYNIESQLFDIRLREISDVYHAINSGNLNNLFEGSGFNDKYAQSLATAKVGQIISPEITSKIGRAHNAEYLIQGTLVNIGSGAWEDVDGEAIGRGIGNALSLASGSNSPILFDQTVSGIGVQVDLRVIRASTGEVVWGKRVVGKKTQTKTEVGLFIKIGTTKLTSEMYSQAMDDATQKIVNILIEDRYKLFLE